MALIDIILPEDQQEGTTATLQSWLKQPGDPVSAHEPIAEIETDKVMMELAAPAAGTITEVLKAEGDEIKPGEIVARIQPGAAAVEQVDTETIRVLPSKDDAHEQTSSKQRVSPVVRKLIQKHNIDPSVITGTGQGGRITARDIERFREQALETGLDPAQPDVAATQYEPQAAAPDASESVQTKTGRMMPHTRMRKRIADHMVTSLLNTAPHVTSVFEADLSAIEHHKKKHKPGFADKFVNLTLTAYFVRACVAAMRVVPEVNSRWHEDALEIFDDINIGVGTALEDGGLVVPVIHKAQDLDLFETAAKLHEFTNKARGGNLVPADVRNGTFTISNHGVSGSLVATPIVINQPQAAILGVGKLQQRPVVREVDGQAVIQARPMCYVTLTIDHRALDALQTNKFLSALVTEIEGWKD